MRVLETAKTLYKVSDFVSWQKLKTLVLSPSFQRRPVWKSGAKSYLVDTVIRGLPIPIIFLRDRETNLVSFEPKREVVDGQQRLRTLFAFIDPLLLPDYDSTRDEFTIQRAHNRELHGLQFKDLPSETKQQILDYQFSVQILGSHVDDREVLQIFARMNSTGVKLNAQELRNAEWFGEFKTSMYELAFEQLPRWRSWKILTEDNLARMDEVSLTSEFAMLMMRGVTGKSEAAITKIYEAKDSDFPERDEVERRFSVVMDAIEDNLGSAIQDLPFRRVPIFYSLFALVYDRLYGIGSTLDTMRQKSLKPENVANIKLAGERIRNGTAPQKVLDAVARRTTHPESRNTVINYLRGG